MRISDWSSDVCSSDLVVLSQLLSSVQVDLMPGGRDPTNFALPQQPLHPALLSNSARYNTLNSVTNPYECSIGGTVFMGTSGQPINDIRMQTRYSQTAEEPDLLALEHTLRWGHLAPPEPDSLADRKSVVYGKSVSFRVDFGGS